MVKYIIFFLGVALTVAVGADTLVILAVIWAFFFL